MGPFVGSVDLIVRVVNRKGNACRQARVQGLLASLVINRLGGESVCNRTSDYEIELPQSGSSICYHEYDYKHVALGRSEFVSCV